MKKDTDNTIAHMYLVPHFHYDVAWIHTEEEEEKRGASLVKQFCDKARSDPQFKFILDQVPLLQAFMRQYILKQGRISNVLTHVKKENILSNIRFTHIPVHGEKLLHIEEAGN